MESYSGFKSKENEYKCDFSTDKVEKVSHLNNELKVLCEQNKELKNLLQIERRKSESLREELRLGRPIDTEDISENFIEHIMIMMKEKLEEKENHFVHLEGKLRTMSDKIASQEEQLTQNALEHEQQVKHLHHLLAEERHLNNVLSEESDQVVCDLQTKLQQKVKLNAEMKNTQKEMTERLSAMEGQCQFYRERYDNEKNVDVIRKEDLACQVKEEDFEHFQRQEQQEFYNDEFLNHIFMQLWEESFPEVSKMNSMKHYTISIFKTIRNGLQKFLLDI